MVVGGSGEVNGKAVVPPSAQSLQDMSKSGVVETWPLAPADSDNGIRASTKKRKAEDASSGQKKSK